MCHCKDISCLCFLKFIELNCVDSSLFIKLEQFQYFLKNILTVSFFPLFLEKKETCMLLC